MEIINNSIEWRKGSGCIHIPCKDNYEIIITGISKVSNYDLQCILSRNQNRFVVNMLNKESLEVLEKIKAKRDIHYLQINTIGFDSDNLINSLPNGIITLHIGYNCWNKKIYNLPNSLKSLVMYCHTNDDCCNLPHGLEHLTLGITVDDIDLSNLPSSIKYLKLLNVFNHINLDNVCKSIPYYIPYSIENDI